MATRVLIVDDNADFHLSLALRLKFCGYAVMSAMTGAEAIAVAAAQNPDVILLDIGLPDRSGHEVARDLAALEGTRHIPIIYLTGRHEASHRIQASEISAAGYLVKPCRPDSLVLAINAAVGSAGTG